MEPMSKKELVQRFQKIFPVILCLSLSVCFFACQSQESITAGRIKAFEKGLLRQVYFKGQKPEKLRLYDRLTFYKVPGLSLAVMDKFKVEWVRTYGYKDVIDYQKITPETVFQVGELSQPVAAAITLRLVDKKQLDLSDDLGPFYTEKVFAGKRFRPADRLSFKIADVLSHSTGFYPWVSPGYPPGATLPDLTQILKGEEPATNYFSFRGFAAGTGVRFSDFNYVLLELYLQEKTGKKLEQLGRDEVFSLLGLKHLSFGQPLTDDLAIGHERPGNAVEGKFYRYPEQAARGLWANPSEYLSLLIELMQCAQGKSGGLLSPEIARAMLSPQADGSGYGFRLEGQHEKFKILLKGKTRGYRSAVLIYPALGQGVVVMTNSENGGVLIEEILHGLSAIYDWPDYKPEEKPLYRLDPSVYAQYVGRYQVDDNYFLDVTYEDYYLIVHPTGQSPTRFYVETQTIFFSVDPFIRIKFNFDENGKVTGLVLWQEDYEVRATKIS
ncbi:MAG: serine hydrolase [Candidatus Aminicenantes bacterium]|nr:serine hydrolase [Candidatus Aminicenantes bacterium]